MQFPRCFLGGIAMVFAGVFAPLGAGETPALTYDNFESPQRCTACHKEIVQEWRQSLMAQAYTHPWDEQEYFKLALPHALKDAKVAEVKAGCIGCHSPLAFLTGDIPPQRVAAGTRANEGVSCDVCHSITGTTEEEPFNFSYITEVDGSKTGRYPDAKSSRHGIKVTEFLGSPKLCAICHDEQSPYGAWVKETYREWKAGPYAKEGVRCQDCHMYHAPGKAALGGKERPRVARHTFHGSHTPSKLAGSVDLALYADRTTAEPGEDIVVRAVLFNGKTGHYIPSGSTEERMLWLEVTAAGPDAAARVIPVEPKGFPGEEYTIADGSILAYQDMGAIMEIENFKGISRDGDVPKGCRIFRRPFFDPQGRMTICQWNTVKNTAIDYRIGPRETKIERYAIAVPTDAAAGELTVRARLLYSQIPTSLGRFLQLPAEESAPITVNEAVIVIAIEK